MRGVLAVALLAGCTPGSFGAQATVLSGPGRAGARARTQRLALLGRRGFSAGGKQALFIGAPSVTVARNSHLGLWTAIYCEPLSNRVVIRTAAELTGPWSDARLLFEASKQPAGAYDANWHPEYDEGSTMYVTYSRSNHKGCGAEFALVKVVLP